MTSSEVPRWKRAAVRLELRADSIRAHECIGFLERGCLKEASVTDRAAVTKRTSFLRGFIVERDFVDMYTQSEVLKELGVLRVKVAKLNTRIFEKLDPSMGKMQHGQTQCFRCKSKEHTVKSSPEFRKRQKCAAVPSHTVPVVLVPDVLVAKSKTDETPTAVPSVLESLPVLVTDSTLDFEMVGALDTLDSALHSTISVLVSNFDETPTAVPSILETLCILEPVGGNCA